jgi:hypothetical protein
MDTITAQNIREEFYPRALVLLVLRNEDDSAPELVKEQQKKDASNSNKSTSFEATWTQVDPIEQKEAASKATSSDKENQQQAKSDKGLRQRKGGNKNKQDATSDEKWTTEVPQEEQDSEARLRKANPIELFGALPPRDLRVAQTNAKAALDAYIEAANLAVAILKLVEPQQQMKKGSASKKK